MKDEPITYVLKQLIWICLDWDCYQELMINIRWLRKTHEYTGKVRRRVSICIEK